MQNIIITILAILCTYALCGITSAMIARRNFFRLIYKSDSFSDSDRLKAVNVINEIWPAVVINSIIYWPKFVFAFKSESDRINQIKTAVNDIHDYWYGEGL